MNKVEVRAEKVIYKNRIDLLVFSKAGSGKISVGRNIEMIELDEVAAIDKPTVSLRMAEAQYLMDDLWRCGVRPTEGEGSAGSLKATQNHLGDMQKIAFKLLKM